MQEIKSLIFIMLSVYSNAPYIVYSDFIGHFGKLPFPSHFGKYILKIGKISSKIHEIGKIGHFWIGNDSRLFV